MFPERLKWLILFRFIFSLFILTGEDLLPNLSFRQVGKEKILGSYSHCELESGRSPESSYQLLLALFVVIVKTRS